MSFTPDVPSTEDVLAAVLGSAIPPLPPSAQHIGSVLASWEEISPGKVWIETTGGTRDDRQYADTLLNIQLAGHGYTRAQFDMDEGEWDVRTAAFEQGWKRGGPGRGLVHPDGTVFTWPESDATHMDMAAGLGIPHNYDRCFAIDPQGQFRMNAWGQDAEALMPTVMEQTGLRPHPYYYPDYRQSSVRTAAWPDIMAKAKRLIQSGQVQLLRNGYQYVVGHIIGDHGAYNAEFSRDDPNSRAITQWQCECPWDQYAFQRTRKWKKYEGRPCSHLLALYWKSLMTPLDEQLSEEQAQNMGTGQRLPGTGPDPLPGQKTEGPAPDSHEHTLPRSFLPDGSINQGDQMQMENGPDATGGPPGPAQAPMSPPPQGPPPGQGPQPPGILPPFPQDQQVQEWAGPGTTPSGMESPPGAMSVPGAKPPSPFNPIQQPGTYSRTADFQAPQTVRLKKPVLGLAEGPVPGQYGDGEYREVPAGTTGEVLAQDQTTGWVEAIFPLDDSGPHEPFHVRLFLEPSDIEPASGTPFIRRRASAKLGEMPALGASVEATTSEVAFLRTKYAAFIDAPATAGHQLWFKPSERPGAEPGRGIIHDPTGTVHTWPENEATHASMIYAKGLRDQDCMRFYLRPNGEVAQIMGPSSAFMTIVNADPALARANGMERA